MARHAIEENRLPEQQLKQKVEELELALKTKEEEVAELREEVDNDINSCLYCFYRKQLIDNGTRWK